MQKSVIAAIVYDDNGDLATTTLWAAINTLQARGVRIDGLVNKCTDEGHHVSEVIQAIGDASEYVILQCLGKESHGCKLNPAALAESSIVLRDAIDQRVDILVINKFGIAEAEGRGLLDEYTRAITEQIPVVSLVHRKYLPAWQNFTAELGEELPVNVDAVINWIQSRLNQE